MDRPRWARELDQALENMEARDLRKAILEILVWAEEPFRGRVVEEVLNQAAAGEGGWRPKGPSPKEVAETLEWAEGVVEGREADAMEMERRLALGSAAFRARNYEDAREIFAALLEPLGAGEIDVGAEELPKDALGPGAFTWAVQYLVAVYMTTSPGERVQALKDALEEVRDFWSISLPLQRMEEAALDPLPGFEGFAKEWMDFLLAEGEKGNLSHSMESWLKEALLRVEGTEGLGRWARFSEDPGDYRSWCFALFRGGDWAGALEACREAGEVFSEAGRERARFLDGAALAAWKLDRPDFSSYLEEAWRAEPTLFRFLRLAGTAQGVEDLRETAWRALSSHLGKDLPVLNFIEILLGDYERPADSLARAPGLGWSAEEHPGHLIFWVFYLLLGGRAFRREAKTSFSTRTMDFFPWVREEKEEGFYSMAPGVEEVLERAEAGRDLESVERETMVHAMRRAAEKRIAGLTAKRRYKHYPHGGLLVAACHEAGCLREIPDPWLAGILQDFSRYPAMVREIQNRLAPGWL